MVHMMHQYEDRTRYFREVSLYLLRVFGTHVTIYDLTIHTNDASVQIRDCLEEGRASRARAPKDERHFSGFHDT